MKIMTFLVCLLIPVFSFAATQVRVYTMDDCTYCHSLMEKLKARHVSFTEIPHAQKYNSFPVTEVNGEVIYGDNISEILKAVKSKK